MALTSITSAENSSMPATSTSSSISPSSVVFDSTSSSIKSEPIKTSKIEPVDTVTLQNKVQNTKPEPRTEKTAKAENKKSDLTRSISDVLFDYNYKGDLRIKFMDSGNQLIYQTPPVLFARITDLMSQTQLTVNTKA